MRQFSIAQYLHANISEEDKANLLWDPESGVFEGYKAPFGWKVGSYWSSGSTQWLTLNFSVHRDDKTVSLSSISTLPNTRILKKSPNVSNLLWTRSLLSPPYLFIMYLILVNLLTSR